MPLFKYAYIRLPEVCLHVFFFFLYIFIFPIRYDNIIILYLSGGVIYDSKKKKIILVVFGQYYLEQVAQLSSFYSNI